MIYLFIFEYYLSTNVSCDSESGVILCVKACRGVNISNVDLNCTKVIGGQNSVGPCAIVVILILNHRFVNIY